MIIDNGRRVLCLYALKDDDPNYIELYRVDGILALQDYDDLAGHPAEDTQKLPPLEDDLVYATGTTLPRSIIARIKGYTEKKRFVCVGSGLTKHNKRTTTIISWADPKEYLTEAQLFWLEMYSQSSFIFTDKRMLQRIFGGIAEIAEYIMKQTPKKKAQKKPKMKRKARRQREQYY